MFAVLDLPLVGKSFQKYHGIVDVDHLKIYV